MKKSSVIKLSLVFSLCLLAAAGGCYINISCCEWPQEKYERVVSLSAPMSAGGSFEAETHNGSIEVVGGDAADCNVTATITGRAMSIEDARKIAEETAVRLESSGNTVAARIDRPVFASNQSVSVAFKVKVPGSTDVCLKTHNGEVEITNITGKISGTTHNGEIEVERTSGNIELLTHNGRIICKEISGDVKLKSHNGKIDAGFSKTAPAVCKTSLITHNGDIDFTAPSNLSAQVKARSHCGTIKTELPITVVGKVTQKELTGTTGTGEGELNLETHCGSIKIRGQK